jgi:hypothetical protein
MWIEDEEWCMSLLALHEEEEGWAEHLHLF